MNSAQPEISNPDQRWSYPGARWWKFDFHTHTPASMDYGKGPAQAALRQITPRDWLLGFMRAGVDCVAVTDHNTGEWIDPLKQALDDLDHERPDGYRQLHLFPGVEITANGNIHILAVLDIDKGTADIDALLGAVGYRGDSGSSDYAADASPIEVLQAISENGYVTVLAHVDGPSGAWQLSGNKLAPILDHEGLFAIEVVDTGRDKPDVYHKRKLAWAEVLGSDSHHPRESISSRSPGSRYSWVKMANPPSLAGLRLALLDGQGFSIRRSDDPDAFNPFELPEHFIEAVEIADARYMGHGQPAIIEFSPWLNAVVGGRGTGKSTIVHALRLVSRRDNELGHLNDRSGPRLTFEGFNRVPKNRMDTGGIQESTKIVWTIIRDGVKHRVHWSRTGNNEGIEEERDGVWHPSQSQIITPERFPIRIFSQGQIVELSGDDPDALLQVIDEAAATAVRREALGEARRGFETLRARVRELDGRLDRRHTLAVELADAERKLARFEEARHAAILKSYQDRSRQKREVDRQFGAVDKLAKRVENAAQALQPEDIPDGLFNTGSKEDQDAISAMDTLASALQSTADDLRRCAQRLRDIIEAQRAELTRSDWQAAIDKATEDYAELVSAVREEGVTDPSEYGRLVQDRQRLDSEIKELDSLQRERDRLERQSQSQLKKVLEARRSISKAREAFLTQTLDQNDFVQIQIRSYGDDPQTIERSLREILDVTDDRFQNDILTNQDGAAPEGAIADLLDGIPSETGQRSTTIEQRIDQLKHRIEAACSGRGSFGGHFNNYLKRKFDEQPGFLDKVWTWFPEDGLRVEYSRGGDGTDFQPISQASAGQRSAAMLAFLLTYGKEPLVLDQPEDDLDNHLIYDLVVRQIRENKLKRQIIVVTHNPNVVVNGDAEMLHALDFVDGQCRVVQSGCLQEEAMREEICRVMEGGHEAFERRYRRLGHKLPHVR